LDSLAYSKEHEEFVAARAVVHFLDHMTNDLKHELTQWRESMINEGQTLDKDNGNPYMESDSEGFETTIVDPAA
jgi:hypothetical protein